MPTFFLQTEDVRMMSPATSTPTAQRGKWMALTAALLGWMFDGFEMGVFPLVGQPALKELLGAGSGDAANRWFVRVAITGKGVG